MAFAKLDTHQVCKKFIFPENKYTKKYAQKVLVNSAFLKHQSVTSVFPS